MQFLQHQDKLLDKIINQNEEIINLTNNLELVTKSYEELKEKLEKLEKGQPDSEIPEQKKEAHRR